MAARHGTAISVAAGALRSRRQVGPRTLGAVAVLGAVGVLLGGCGGAGRDSSYFAMRPVTGRLSPPCVTPALGRVTSPGGPVVACLELGPTAVDASDVESAVVRPDASTKTTRVEFELTPAGVERFNALARTVGMGGEAAILVDGAIVSVPRLETTEFNGRGVVTGLDPAAAQRLATRLTKSAS